MRAKNEGENFLNIDVSLLSHQNLVEIIKQLEDSAYVAVRKKAQKELVRRLKDKGFDNKKIAMMLTSNVYGKRKRLTIAKEWVEALEISESEFMKLIG
jgi:broad-specificity NMP kinase